jgi:hypothetical protein
VRTPRKWISASLFAGAIVAAGGIALWRIPAVQAEDAVVVNGLDAADHDNYRGGSASNSRVKPFLEAHPDQFVVLCIAGCNGAKREIVELLPRPVKGHAAEFQPSVAGPKDKGKGKGQFAAEDSDDVVCLAGCTGKPGQVLQRDLDLPPLPIRCKRRPQMRPRRQSPRRRLSRSTFIPERAARAPSPQSPESFFTAS